MINATQYAQPSAYNQQLTAQSRQTGAIQAPTPSANVLAAVPQAGLGGVTVAADSAERFKQELQQWIDQAPGEEEKYRVEAAKRIFEVYEKGGACLDLSRIYHLTSVPYLGELTDLQALNLGLANICESAEKPLAVKTFFYGLALLCNLRTLKLSYDCPGELGVNSQWGKAFFDGLSKLGNLQSLTLRGQRFYACIKNPQAAEAFTDSLGQLGNLRNFTMSHCHLGRLEKNPQAVKAFFNGLGKLGNLQVLDLGVNQLGALLQNPYSAEAFAEVFSQLSNLKDLDLCQNDLEKLAENPQAAKAFFTGLGQLSNLQSINLSVNDLGAMSENSLAMEAFADNLGKLGSLQTLILGTAGLGVLINNQQFAKAFAESLGKLTSLQTLDLHQSRLYYLNQNLHAARALAEGLGKLENLQSLDLSGNSLGILTDSPQAAHAFIEGLGKLKNLRKLFLNVNDIFSLFKNEEVARAFLDSLRQFRQLRELGLTACQPRNWTENPRLAKLFFDVLGNFSHLRSLDLYRNSLHEIFCDYPVVTEALFNCVVQLEQLQDLSLPPYFDDNGYGEDWFVGWEEDPRSIVYGQVCGRFKQLIAFRASLRQQHIESEYTAIIEQGQRWTPTMAKKLHEQCATVTDAVSAYEILAHVQDKGELSWSEVQSKLEIFCLAVAKKLIDADTQGEEALAKVRNQELAYLLTLVQHGAKIGALTNTAALNIQLHIQNNPRINQAFSTIQALQQSQQAMSVGLQAMCNALGQNIQPTAQLQMQYNDCFQQLAKNQQQLLIKQNQLERAHGSMRESLKAEIETLRSNQVQVANNLHQVGLKMLSAQRIKAIGGLLATGVAFQPWVGAGIVEGGRAIANALGVARAQSFAAGLESLKDSLASIGSASVFQTLSLEQQNLTLGEALQAHGIQLPSDTLTMQFANIKLGDLVGNTTIQQSHGALPRADSTGSLATEDEEQDELAAAIKYYDESNEYSVEYLNNLVEDAVGDEQRMPMSTILTVQTLPTRNSNTRRATALDLAAQYGRPQVLETLNNAARATRNSPNAVKLKSAQGKVFSRALSEAISRQGIYNSLGQRVISSAPKPEVQ